MLRCKGMNVLKYIRTKIQKYKSTKVLKYKRRNVRKKKRANMQFYNRIFARFIFFGKSKLAIFTFLLFYFFTFTQNSTLFCSSSHSSFTVRKNPSSWS